MATRNVGRDEPTERDVRAALVIELSARLSTASTNRVATGDGRGHYGSRADQLDRQLTQLETGAPLTIESWRLPEPWCKQWHGTVIVNGDGTISIATRVE